MLAGKEAEHLLIEKGSQTNLLTEKGLKKGLVGMREKEI